MAPKLAASFVLVLGLAMSASAGATDPPSCRLQKYGQVELGVTNDSVTLPASVNGKAVRLALNIGSAYSAFWGDALNGLDLRRAELSSEDVIRIDGREVSYLAAFRSLSMGDIPFGRGTFLIAPPGKPHAKDVVGFIGMSAFQKVDFELDLAHRTLILFSQNHCPGAGQNRFADNASMPLLMDRSGQWHVPIELEGHKVAPAFSSGEPLTTLSRDVARRLYGFDEDSPGVHVARDELRGTSYHYKAMQFTAPGLKVLNPTIALVPGLKDCGLLIREHGVTGYTYCSDAYPVYIGLDILLKLRLYFATKERMLYFAAAEPRTADRPQP